MKLLLPFWILALALPAFADCNDLLALGADIGTLAEAEVRIRMAIEEQDIPQIEEMIGQVVDVARRNTTDDSRVLSLFFDEERPQPANGVGFSLGELKNAVYTRACTEPQSFLKDLRHYLETLRILLRDYQSVYGESDAQSI